MTTSEVDYRWLGIDVSKAHLDVYDLSQQVSTRYGNDSEGIEQLKVQGQNLIEESYSLDIATI